MIFVAFIQEDNTMFHSDGIDGIFELKNFIADLTSRFDDVSMPYFREHFSEFLSLCEKAGLEKDYLAFYYFYELPNGKRWIEYSSNKL